LLRPVADSPVIYLILAHQNENKMVRYDPKNWWGLIFQFHKSDTFRRLFWIILSIAIFSLVIAYLTHEVLGEENFKSTTIFHSLLGFVISLLLVFRTNTAYDRWWEGRRLWGQLVNDTRTISLKLDVFLPKEDLVSRTRMAELLGDFPTILKEHLRNNKVAGKYPTDIHQPNYIAHLILSQINTFYKDKKIQDNEYLSLINDFNTFQTVAGACERIKNTPIPYSYSLFIKKFIFIYILSMPFAMVMEFHYYTALIVPFVFYVFGSLELIAEGIEDPFSTDSDDLPTDQIAKNIGINSQEIFTPYAKTEEEEAV
jgi:putative membrane protein